MTKKTLRKHYLEKRKNLDAQTRRAYDSALTQQLLTLPAYQSTTYIACYYSDDTEAGTQAFIQAATAAGKQIYLPKVVPPHLEFFAYGPETKLIKNRFGIDEPLLEERKKDDSGSAISLNAIELFLLPLVAFDAQGNRLGRGAGHYDRTLQSLAGNSNTHRPMLIGLAYNLQKSDTLPTDPWDISLDGIVTESGFLATQ